MKPNYYLLFICGTVQTLAIATKNPATVYVDLKNTYEIRAYTVGRYE